MGLALRAQLWLLLVEVGLACAGMLLVPKLVKLVVLAPFMVVQCMLTVGAVRGAEQYRRLDELRRFQNDVHARMWAMTASAWLQTIWWLVDTVDEFQGDCGFRCHQPVDAQLATIAAGFLSCNLVASLHSLYWSWTCSHNLVQSVLPGLKLQGHRFAEVPRGWAGEENHQCAICLEDYGADDSVVLLPCHHLFHLACLSQWLLSAESCPLRCQGIMLKLPADVPKPPAPGCLASTGSRSPPPELELGSAGAAAAPGASAAAAAGRRSR